MTDLDDLDRLAAAATPGPWDRFYDDYDKGTWCVVADNGNGGPVVASGITDETQASLIVALVNAAPSLIAELRAARTVVAAARAYVVHIDSREHEDGDGCYGELEHAALLEVPE